MSKTRVLIAAAAAALGLTQTAGADEGAAFYKGRTITLVIGFAAGGGADTFARFFAPHFANHMPGKPNVIVQNMPGAGGLKALNHVYNTPPQDGTRVMLTSPSHTLAYLLGRENIRFDINKIKWIGTLTQDTQSCAASGSSGFKSIVEARDKEMIVGATGASSSSAQHAYLLANMLGYKLKVVSGYSGTAKVRLAMETGEVHVVCAFWASAARGPQAQDIKSGKLVPIVQMGQKPVPVFGKAPVVYDLARDNDERQIMRVIFATTELSRPFAAPPDTPDLQLATLRKGFWDSVHSSELQADAKRRKLTVDPLNSQDTEAAFREILSIPKHLVERAKQVISK